MRNTPLSLFPGGQQQSTSAIILHLPPFFKTILEIQHKPPQTHKIDRRLST